VTASPFSLGLFSVSFSPPLAYSPDWKPALIFVPPADNSRIFLPPSLQFCRMRPCCGSGYVSSVCFSSCALDLRCLPPRLPNHTRPLQVFRSLAQDSNETRPRTSDPSGHTNGRPTFVLSMMRSRIFPSSPFLPLLRGRSGHLE